MSISFCIIVESLQFVSNFTKKPNAFIFFINSNKFGCNVGSHQHITTQSKIHFLLFKKLKKIFSGIKSFWFFAISSGRTVSGLWQNGQRRLQPDVKIVQATLLG